MKIQNSDDGKRIWTMVKILIVLFIFSMFIAAIHSDDSDNVIGYNTAVIPVVGEITTSNGGGLFSDETAGSTNIVQEIERATQDKNVKAIIFEINSVLQKGQSFFANTDLAKIISAYEGRPRIAKVQDEDESADDSYGLK